MISQTPRWEETYILTTFLMLKFSKGVESGSCPLSFWITICCMILSSSSQYWTVLPLLLSRTEKRDRDHLHVCKLGGAVFSSGHLGAQVEPRGTPHTPLLHCCEASIYFEIKVNYRSFWGFHNCPDLWRSKHWEATKLRPKVPGMHPI